MSKEPRLIKETKITLPPDEIIKEFKQDENFDIPEDIDKFKVIDDRVKIDFETRGRFSTPATVNFSDYTTRDISNLVMSKGETMMETLIAILSEKADVTGFKAEDLLVEEFYEVLLGLKAQFAEDGRAFVYQYLCKCQKDIDEKDQILSKETIDLHNLKYTSIEQAEEKIRAGMREELSKYSAEQMKKYIRVKYKDDRERTIDQIVEDFRIQEPLYILVKDNVFELRFTRVGDLARAIKIASTKYNAKIRAVKARPGRQGVPGEEIASEKAEEIAKLEEQKEKDTVLISQALCLVRKNGIELNYEQRIQEFSQIPKNIFGKYADYRSKMRFGLNDERDFKCNLCGHTERRALHRDFTIFTLLPFQSGEGSTSARKLTDNTATIVFM